LRQITLHILLSIFISAPILAGDTEVLIGEDLQSIGRISEEKQLPILLVVSQEYCPFCTLLKSEILNPMVLSGNYRDSVIIREIMIDHGESLIDFKGVSRASSDFARSYKVWVTPTLLFLDPEGHELRPRMLGVNTIEMYGYYLDQNITDARYRLRKKRSEVYIPSSEDLGVGAPHNDKAPRLVD